MKNITTMIICTVFNIIIMILGNYSYAQQDLTEVVNFGAESGRTGWLVENGAALTINSYGVPSKRYGKKYFTVTFGTSSVDSRVYQTFTSPTVLNANARCVLSVTYRRNDTNNDLKKLEVGEVGSPALSKAINLVGGTGTSFREIKSSIPCPTSGSLYIQIRSTTLVDATIDFDNIVISTYEQRNYYVEASIRSTTAADNINRLTYNDIVWTVALSNANLEMVVHRDSSGTANPFISCDSGFGVGLNCGAINENFGISVVINQSGIYKVCAAFSAYTNTTTDAGNIRISRQNLNSQSENPQTGVNILNMKGQTAVVAITPIRLCETFIIESNVNAAGGFGELSSRIQFNLFGRRSSASGPDSIDIYLAETTTAVSRLIWSIERVTE